MRFSVITAMTNLLFIFAAGCDGLWNPFYTGNPPDRGTEPPVCVVDAGSSDGGPGSLLLNDWERVASYPCVRWNGITVTPAGDIWMVGSNGTIGFISSEQVLQVSKVPVPVIVGRGPISSTEDLIAVAGYASSAGSGSNQKAVAISKSSAYLLDFVGNASVSKIPEVDPGSGRLTSIWLKNAEVGYIATSINRNFKLTPGGWIPDSVNGSSSDEIIDVSGDENSGSIWVLNSNGFIYKLISGGTWASPKFMGNELRAANASALSVLDDGFVLYGASTGNAGFFEFPAEILTPISGTQNTPAKYDIFPVAKDNIWFVGDAGNVVNYLGSVSNGGTPVTIMNSYNVALRGVCVTGSQSQGAVWIVAADGTLYRRLF
jgi:hypothetical protein